MSVDLIDGHSRVKQQELNYGLMTVLRGDMKEALLRIVKLIELRQTTFDQLLEERTDEALLSKFNCGARMVLAGDLQVTAALLAVLAGKSTED